jgi:hypothetical protein
MLIGQQGGNYQEATRGENPPTEGAMPEQVTERKAGQKGHGGRDDDEPTARAAQPLGRHGGERQRGQRQSEPVSHGRKLSPPGSIG